MKAQKGKRTIALDGVGWWGLCPRHFSHGKGVRYPLYRRLGGGGAGTFWTGAENLAPTGILSPDRPASSSVIIPTELSRPTRPTQPSIQRVRGVFLRGSSRSAKFTTHLQLALALRVSAAVPLFLCVPPPRALVTFGCSFPDYRSNQSLLSTTHLPFYTPLHFLSNLLPTPAPCKPPHFFSPFHRLHICQKPY